MYSLSIERHKTEESCETCGERNAVIKITSGNNDPKFYCVICSRDEVAQEASNLAYYAGGRFISK